MFLNVCTKSSVLTTIYYVKSVLELICFIVPAILVVVIGYQLYKIVTLQNEVEIKHIKRSIINKVIAAITIFFVPTLVGALGILLGEDSVLSSECWNSANASTIEVYKAAEEQKEKAEEEAKKTENEKAEAERQRIEGIRELANAENEEEAEEARKKIQSQETLSNGSSKASGTAAQLLQIAEQQIGISGRPNKFTYGYGSIGGYSYAWCAAFVWWCSNEAGVYPNIVTLKSAAVLGYKAYFQEKGQYKVSAGHGGDYTPKMGDYIIFDWQGNTSDGDHIGLVKGVEGGNVITIEGNTSDSVAQRTYSLTSSSIIGYGVWE